MIHKPALNNSKWTINKLNEDNEIENCNNRIKQNLNYTDRDNRYKSTMGEIKTRNNNSCERYIRDIKATT